MSAGVEQSGGLEGRSPNAHARYHDLTKTLPVLDLQPNLWRGVQQYSLGLKR